MKIVLCGDHGVGKTTIREKFFGRGFQSKYMVTKGAEFSLKEYTINGHILKFQIWQLAVGESKFPVRSVYYLGSLGAILVFDVTQPNSFKSLELWVNEIWNKNGKGAIPLAIVGNKIDLRDNGNYEDSISDDRAIKYCEKLSESIGFSYTIQYFPFSAKFSKDTNKILEYLGKNYLDYLDSNKST